MKLGNFVRPVEQQVTFIELFFDLVFVFAVTQVVSLLHHDITWLAAGQAFLVFWLVWSAWTQFTWALNAANAEHELVAMGTLVATIVAFFMSVALPDTYHGRALAFALPYVVVRVVGQLLYIAAAWSDPEKRSAVLSFGLVSVGGMSAVLIGAWLGGNAIYWLWILGSIIDMVAAALGGRSEGWKLDRHHFSERHGLFVIIALGETLIVAGTGLTGVEWEGPLVGAALLAVAATFGFWWSYFPYAKPRIDRALHHLQQKRLTVICRDVFTLLHLPMLCGLILFAAVTAQVLEHPEEALHLGSRAALAAGLMLFVGGMAMALWRATGRLSIARLIAVTLAGALVLALDHVSPLLSLGLVALGAWVPALIEVQVHPWVREQTGGSLGH